MRWNAVGKWKVVRMFRLIAGLLILSLCADQTSLAAPMAQAPLPEQSSPGTTGETITAPLGTVVPLTLVSPIKRKSTKVGDTVRAMVAFPITVGAQVAIPAGTYVEGVVTSLTAQMKKTRQPEVQIHFTRLLYANGYSAVLDAANTQAKNVAPGGDEPGVSETAALGGDGLYGSRIAFYGGEGFAYRAQSTTLPTLPSVQVGPSKPWVIVIVGGTIGAFLALAIVTAHHRNNSDYVLFDAGWQFQMALTSPLAVNAAQVSAAAATPSH
jgi:hypothetical protein